MKAMMAEVEASSLVTLVEVLLTQPMSSFAPTSATVLPSLENPRLTEATKVRRSHSWTQQPRGSKLLCFAFLTLLSVSNAYPFSCSHPTDVSPARTGPPAHPVPNDLHDLEQLDGPQDLLRCARVLR